MNSTAIKQSAFILPTQDRAHFVHVLLDSVDAPSGTDIHDIRLDEARRQADEIDAGKVILVNGEQFEQQVQAFFM